MATSAGALRAGKAVIECVLLVKPIEKQLRKLQAKVQTVGRSFANLGRSGMGGAGGGGMGGGGMGGGFAAMFAGGGAAAALLYPIKMAAGIEMASAQMSVFTGSAAVSRDMMLQLQTFSGQSMVPTDNLNTAAALLLRYNVAQGRVIADTKALAVIAGGNTDEFEKLSLAYAQVASAGRLQGEEMRQFKNTAFNPLREIADQTGESLLQVKDRMEAGGISFTEVANALQRATGPGGRFAKMLALISDTLSGQFYKAIAEAKKALLPIGEAALGGLKQLFQAINGLIPIIAAVIKQYSSWINIVLILAAATAIAAVGFIAFAMAAQVLSVAIGGIAAILGLLISVFGFLISWPGLAVVAINALVGWFFLLTEQGKRMGSSLITTFQNLWTVFKVTLGGIANAMIAGNLSLAAEIMWAGLKTAWLAGTRGLLDIWIDFKNEFMKMIAKLSLEVMGAWATISANVKIVAGSVLLDAIAFQEKLGKSDEEKARIDAANEVTKDVAANAVRSQALSRVQAYQAIQDQLDAAFAAKTDKEKQDADAALAAAKQKLVDLSGEADVLAAVKLLKDFNTTLGLGGQEFDPGAVGAEKADNKQQRKQDALFDTRLMGLAFGHGEDIQQQQLRVQKQIASNTGRGRGGLPVI